MPARSPAAGAPSSPICRQAPAFSIFAPATALPPCSLPRTGAAARIVAVDQAEIDPPAFVSRHAELYARIEFRGGTNVEALPFGDGGFDAVVSQYGIEYSDLSRALPEAVRMVAPGGRIRFVVHAADGVVAHSSKAVIADADLLLGEIDLPGHAARCFEAVIAVERDGGDAAHADSSFAAFPGRADPHRPPRPRSRRTGTMFRNSGAVLLDTFQRRGHFDLDQLLSKVEEVRSEIAAHRGRLAALVERRSTRRLRPRSPTGSARSAESPPAARSTREAGADRPCDRGALPLTGMRRDPPLLTSARTVSRCRHGRASPRSGGRDCTGRCAA